MNNLVKRIKQAYLTGNAWIIRRVAIMGAECGASLKRIVVAILLAFIGFIFVINFVPMIEDVSTANITNPLTRTIADMGIWVLPVGGIIGVFYGVFRLFGGGGKGD